MSYLVLHMDKFKKEAIRGIQSHNRRERESHSNPDIDYDRSAANYELHESASSNYTEAIQNRVDDLLLVKAVRKDAVRMCGLIVTSDSAFFQKLSPEDTRRFFEESKAFLTDFVGAENVISAMVHMDEKTPHNVSDNMEEQKAITNMGGTMRLGAYECVLQKGSKAYQAYGQEHIQERHRHRYEFNNDYKDRYEAAGMKCVGINPESDLVEIVEIPTLKWFVGTQFHPEYGSTVLNPHPLFVAFVKAAIENEKTTAKG